MVGIDFDFSRYVAHRRGMVEQRARDGSAYSYLGERKVRRTLTSARPVTLALEAASRLWRSKGRSQLLSSGQKTSDRDFPGVFHAAHVAAKALGLEAVPVVVAEPGVLRVPVQVLGVDDDPVIALSRSLVDSLSEQELVAVLGQQLGHVQNDHVVYTTALYYLQHDAAFVVRWVVKPAVIALQAWSRRAEITCDRAALLAVRDLDTALATIIKLAMPDADDDRVKELLSDDELDPKSGGLSRYTEVFRSHPHLPKRLAALRIFAESSLYLRVVGDDKGGLTTDDVDVKVGEILSVFS